MMASLFPLLSGGGGRTPLILDPWDYAALVLNRRDPPWTETAQLVSLARQSVGLLKPDALLFPMLEWMRAALDTRPALKGKAAERPRAVYPLKTVLSDESLRKSFVETVGALVSAMPAIAIVPVVAAPELWLALAYRAAHGREIETVDDDMREQAEVFLAGFLSPISGTPIGGVLIDEIAATVDEAWATVHSPLINSCVHYRWSLGVSFGVIEGALPPGVNWAIGSSAATDPFIGVRLEPGAWSDDAQTVSGRFYAARIPKQSNPESVLARLEILRKAGN